MVSTVVCRHIRHAQARSEHPKRLETMPCIVFLRSGQQNTRTKGAYLICLVDAGGTLVVHANRPQA